MKSREEIRARLRSLHACEALSEEDISALVESRVEYERLRDDYDRVAEALIAAFPDALPLFLRCSETMEDLHEHELKEADQIRRIFESANAQLLRTRTSVLLQ